jgi:choline kinase
MADADAQTLILAAGLGSRLKDLTTATPKALIAVAGRPLVDYALAFARAAAGPRRGVVGGFCHADVAARVARVAPDAVIRDNGDFRRGNLLTLRAGLPALAPGAGMLLMNTDHVYRPTIAAVVADAIARATEVTAFCDFDRPLGADDMKVALDDERRVRAMSKTLSAWGRRLRGDDLRTGRTPRRLPGGR